MGLEENIILWFVCTLISCTGTLAGVGGGLFLVPLLNIFYNVPFNTCIVVSSYCLISSSLYSSLIGIKNNQISYKTLLGFEVSAMPGTFIGSKLLNIIPLNLIIILFSLFTLFWGLQIVFKKKFFDFNQRLKFVLEMRPMIKIRLDDEQKNVSLPLLFISGFMSGILAGILGIGGGIVKTPIMLSLLDYPLKLANSTAHLTILFTSVSSSISHGLNHPIPWSFIYPLSICFLLGSIIGNKLLQYTNKNHIKYFFGHLLVLVSVALLVKLK